MLVAANLVCGMAFVLALFRLIKGPTLPDRVVGLDLMGTVGVSWLAVSALQSRDAFRFDLAVVLALIGFLGTVAISRYLQRIQAEEVPHND